MTLSKETCDLFNIPRKDGLIKGVVPEFLEKKYIIIGAIEEIKSKSSCDTYEMAGLLKCLSSSDEEEVRESALRAICEVGEDELKKLAITIASFDSDEDVLSSMLEEANELNLDFRRDIAKRFVSHESLSVSNYAKGMLDLCATQ